MTNRNCFKISLDHLLEIKGSLRKFRFKICAFVFDHVYVRDSKIQDFWEFSNEEFKNTNVFQRLLVSR